MMLLSCAVFAYADFGFLMQAFKFLFVYEAWGSFRHIFFLPEINID